MPESVGRVKACTECRQQKVRCDAYKQQPCSRCRSTALPCVISKEFHRRPRQSKAQLQHELERLKAAAEKVVPRGRTEDNEVVEPPQKRRRRRTTIEGPSQSSRDQSEPSVYLRELPESTCMPSAEAADSALGYSPPTDRSDITDLLLEDIVVESYKIKDCYALFTNNYAPHIEGLLDPAPSIEKYHQHSPLLFWTIIYVGSRSYTKDPSLFARLGPAVLRLAFNSLLSPPDPLPVLQAAIILCNWPHPVELIYKEPCQALAGAAANIAVQNGFHMYIREQDFIVKSYNIEKGGGEPEPMNSRPRVRDETVISRTRLWVHALVTFHNTHICDGLPPIGLTTCFRRSEVYDLLPEMPGYRLRLHKIQIEAINTISGSCAIEGDGDDNVLNAMIISYDDRVRDVPMPQEDNLYMFISGCVRVCILGLIWLVQREPSHRHVLRLYRVVREVISLADALNRSISNFTDYLPYFFVRMLLYCSHVVVRVHKSSLRETLDDDEGAEAALEVVKGIITRRSLGQCDILAINVAVLTQLWTSTKAFVHDDGDDYDARQNGLRVDVRCRMILNPITDSVWWWRKEFGSTYVSNKPAIGPREKEMVETGREEEDDGLQNFDRVFRDFQAWWDFSDFPMLLGEELV